MRYVVLQRLNYKTTRPWRCAVDAIQAYEKHMPGIGEDDGRGGSIVYVPSGQGLRVLETPEEIDAILRQAGCTVPENTETP